MPELDNLIKRGIHIQKNLRKSKTDFVQHFLLVLPDFPDITQITLSHCCHISILMNSVSSCTSRYLFYFLKHQRSLLRAIKLLHLDKYYPFYRKIKSHSNSICRHDHLRLPTIKHFHLTSSDFRRQASIDHTRLYSIFLKTCCNIKHSLL